MNQPKPIKFPTHADGRGLLGVYEAGAAVPFEIKRVFTVSAMAGEARGHHAHKQCKQLMVCVAGKVRVKCDDGRAKSEFVLDGMSAGLLVEPGIWAMQEYLADDSVLMVLCDRGYEADDYIRSYDDFKTFIGSGEAR